MPRTNKNLICLSSALNFISCIAEPSYGRSPNGFCRNVQVEVNSLDAAKTECSRRSNCPMFYDWHGEGTRFLVCMDPPGRRFSSLNSVLYVKNGMYINVLIALPI